MSPQKQSRQKIKVTWNKQTGIWEVTLKTKQSKTMINNILDWKTKIELAQYFHATLFSLTTKIFLKAIRLGFLKTWTFLIQELIKKHIEKLTKTTMGNLQMIQKGVQLTRKKPRDTSLEDN